MEKSTPFNEQKKPENNLFVLNTTLSAFWFCFLSDIYFPKKIKRLAINVDCIIIHYRKQF